MKSCGLHGRAKLEVTLGWKKAFEARVILAAEMWAEKFDVLACWALLELNARASKGWIQALIQKWALVVESKVVGQVLLV